MSSLKPPIDPARGRSRAASSREHEQRLISQLTFKRNSVLLQLRAAQREDAAGGLAASRCELERLADELERHLDAVSDAAQQRTGQPPIIARGRRAKRPAPPPPAVILPASSAPNLAEGAGRYLPSPDHHTSRRKLKKSLSLSGSRSFFATVLATLRGGSRPRAPETYRRSRSQESLHLAPLDQDQKIVNEAAVRAQLRRGNKVRSFSAEPRQDQLAPSARSRHESGPGKEGAARRPDRLFLPSSQSVGRHRYAPRERSPLAMKPPTPQEFITKPPTPDCVQTKYFVPGVSESALQEIEAFEKLIAKFMQGRKCEVVTT